MIDREQLQEKIDELQALLDHSETAYEYEKAFDEQWSAIGREVLEQSLGSLPEDRNKKKDTD